MGSPKSRQKEPCQLISVRDKVEGVKRSEHFADVLYVWPLTGLAAILCLAVLARAQRGVMRGGGGAIQMRHWSDTVKVNHDRARASELLSFFLPDKISPALLC